MTRSPLPYGKEFAESRANAFRSRLFFFCAFTTGLYLSISILALAMDPSAFKPAEITVWVFLAASAGAAMAVMSRLPRMPARTGAAIFACALLAALGALFVIYPDYIAQSSEVFALGVFLIAFLMPWSAAEVAVIGALAALGYSAVFYWASANLSGMGLLVFAPGGYVDGLIFLVNAVVISAIVRMRDNAHDRHRFGLMRELEEKNAQMQKELAIARDIHRTLIPRSTSTDHAAVAVSYIPLSTVGGDYATFHVTAGGDLFFLIGDVTGHGVPAALLVNRVYGEIESLVAKNPAPGALMMELDAFVQEHFQSTNMYFSVCSGLIDFKRRTLFYSNYGHPPQILCQHRDNAIRLLESQTYFLGIEASPVVAGERRVYEGQLPFEHRDRIVLFTDGLIETKNAAGEMYGMPRLETFIKSHAGGHPTQFNADLIAAIDAFRSGPVADDMFLVTIDIK